MRRFNSDTDVAENRQTVLRTLALGIYLSIGKQLLYIFVGIPNLETVTYGQKIILI